MSYKIVFIGSGNVATHLALHLKAAGQQIIQIFSPQEKNAKALALQVDALYTHQLSEIFTEADLYLIAVKDDAISHFMATLRLPGKVVAHTSGAVTLKGLEDISASCGVFYPFQTFTKTSPVNFNTIPLFIQAENNTAKRVLMDVAQSLSKLSQEITEQQRQALHLSAVFANNFTNHIFHISKMLLADEKMPFELLFPLIKETVAKLSTKQPFEVQTGPARRADWKTVDEHLRQLEKYPDYKEIYLILSESIMNTYKASNEAARQ